MIFAPLTFALVIGIATLIAALAALFPLRWGWKAFPLAVVTSVLIVTCLFLSALRLLYRDGGGFVVHFNPLHLAAAIALGAMGFWAIQRIRVARTNDG